MTRDEILARVRGEFATVERPERFVRVHCCECAEHNDTLAAHKPDTISLEQLGNPGWDPMCFATAQAFAYYMPAMIRLAFGDEYYLDQLLFHLNVPDRVNGFTAPQAAAVLEALWGLQRTFEREIAEYQDEYRIEEAMQRLEKVIRGEVG